jgi:protein TonB
MDGDRPNLGLPRRTRIAVSVLVALVLVGLFLLLIRALAPDFTAQAAQVIGRTLSVTIYTPPPEPSPQPEPAGASGEAGRRATPREAAIPKPTVSIATAPAPQASSTGSADTSGARDAGAGTGAGGTGSGTGLGGSGTGGGASKPVHISGRIDKAADFPVPPGGREARIGKAVILALTISPEGRATGCRIYKSSGLPETDEATCRLAKERLRFKPALNTAGEPVTGTFYWQQKFFF